MIQVPTGTIYVIINKFNNQQVNWRQMQAEGSIDRLTDDQQREGQQELHNRIN